MAASDDLINFDLIEEQKENIQSLPGGRSAKKLALLYSPSPLHKLSTPTPTDTKNVNDCIRAEYEAEVQSMSESDDPLDVFDRYVRWTLDAYPSAQATPQSQLHTLLERATKAFITSAQYKNDPRYLRLWMYYIHFFSDNQRETYMFLSRHGIGENLALFYEEYAAWLESASRWTQAEEVYKLGIEREARPVQRLLRKFKEFEERLSQQPSITDSPSSPALPTVRPALAAKTNPFEAVSRTDDPQAPRQGGGLRNAAPKSSKPKLAVFSDTDAKPSALSSREPTSKGWDTIGSLSDRKKENTMEPKPWVGETLSSGSKKAAPAKMAVFRDPFLAKLNDIVVVPSKHQVTVHPQTGKKERIHIDLMAVYPTPDLPGTELSFEEIIAANRGWLDISWSDCAADMVTMSKSQSPPSNATSIQRGPKQKLAVHHDPVFFDENGAVKETQMVSKVVKKKKAIEVNETQVIKAKLDSPSGTKLRKKQGSEPTMTLHTRAATNDIYEIFNAPLNSNSQEQDNSDEDEYETDGDYTTDAESTGTNKHVDQTDALEEDDVKSLSEWSDFIERKHIPLLESDIAALDREQDNAAHGAGNLPTCPAEGDKIPANFCDGDGSLENETAVEAPSDDESPRTRTIFIPMPPEDYEPPTRPYRDAAEVANNRLPFMTPITERTESSLDVELPVVDQYKTPCKQYAVSPAMSIRGAELFSSPVRDIPPEEPPIPSIPAALAIKANASPKKTSIIARPLIKGPIIKDKQCNPIDEDIRREILENSQPPLSSYVGFHDSRSQRNSRAGEIRKFAKALSKAGRGSGADKAGSVPCSLPLDFPGTGCQYSVKRELGSGAFAFVYLVENHSLSEDNDGQAPISQMGKGQFAVSNRTQLEALKLEMPPSPWEFHMMRVVHSRLGPQHRAASSISYAHEMHLYKDEAFLMLPYHPNGTLLDVVNHFRAEPSGVMEEQLTLFFTIELLRTVEALHAKNVIHGDLKADNCLLRLDHLAAEQNLSSQWRADGLGGWACRGVTLLDFGRSIDMRSFVSDVEFIADWKPSDQDCAEVREGRPWTWQIDYYGLAGIIHCLLFGKYIETARCDEGGLGRMGRKYRIKESLKRYWQTDLWSDCFEMLLNPASFQDREDGGRLPLLRSMKSIRERMEACLEANCEKGVGMKSMMGRVEAYAKSRR